MDDEQLGWIFGKNGFIASLERTRQWIYSLLGEELATKLDYQIRSQGVKFSKFGIDVNP